MSLIFIFISLAQSVAVNPANTNSDIQQSFMKPIINPTTTNNADIPTRQKREPVLGMSEWVGATAQVDLSFKPCFGKQVVYRG
jgi:hypothetical protein